MTLSCLQTGYNDLKKYVPYILAGLLIGAVLVLFVTGDNRKKRQLDERVTLRKGDKIPYATYIAFNNLNHLFPSAAIHVSRLEPGYWDSVQVSEKNQAFIAVTDKFGADKEEMNRLIDFAEAGNDVFISARYVSSAADQVLGCSSSAFDLSFMQIDDTTRENKVLLHHPPFSEKLRYDYPGKAFHSYFTEIDSSTTEVLGYDESGKPNFIHLKAGKGNFYVHLEPLVFCNYFLLHKNNISYYEKALSVIDKNVSNIVWDEYYLRKKGDGNNRERKKGWLSVLFRYPAFRAALLTAIFTLILYVLMEMRRRQRFIPVVKKPKNDSLDFVKTIGRLYYDKADHKNLCRKMASYFLEHVRSRYKLPTGKLDDDFIRLLHYKSGVSQHEVSDLVSFIKHIDQADSVSEKQLTFFHKQLESFYQKA